MAQRTRITRYGFVNCWLVDEDDGLTLIDTTLPRSRTKILAAAAELGKPIVRIVLTHAHGDHIGSLDELAARLPDAEVSMSARDARIMGGDKSLDAGEEGKIKGSLPRAKTVPGRMLAGGDRVGSLEVYASPGHTPGHISLIDTRDRTLYTGDAYYTMGGVATAATANLSFPLPAMATWSKQIAVESARALRALDPSALATGHGKLVESPGAAMDAAIRKAS